MDLTEAIETRHSVRAFTDEPIDPGQREELERIIAEENAAGDLHMRLICDEPKAFRSTMAHYGRFRNVRTYLVLAGVPADDLEERCGYHGERVVLEAQRMGLNSCWVALTFKRRQVRRMLEPGDRLVVVVALGHSTTQGVPHRSKDANKVATGLPGSPDWFQRGVEAALLAPTSINQQSFLLTLVDGRDDDGVAPTVRVESKGGPYATVDLGIVKRHFELGAGRPLRWA